MVYPLYIVRLSDSFGGNKHAIPAKTQKSQKYFRSDQNSLRLLPASIAIRADTGSFTLAIMIMAAMT